MKIQVKKIESRKLSTRRQTDAAEQLTCSRKQTELILQDSQCAHDCRIEADVAVFNMLMTVD